MFTLFTRTRRWRASAVLTLAVATVTVVAAGPAMAQGPARTASCRQMHENLGRPSRAPA